MFEIKKTSFGWTVSLNGLVLRVFDSETDAAGYVEHMRDGQA